MRAAGAMETRESAEPNSMIGIRMAAAQQGLILERGAMPLDGRKAICLRDRISVQFIPPVPAARRE